MAHIAKHDIYFNELGHTVAAGEALPDGYDHLLKGNEGAFEDGEVRVDDDADKADDDDKGHAETKRTPHRPAQGKPKE